MKPRKRFHCGDKFCHICNTKLEAHKNWIEYFKKMQPIWARQKAVAALADKLEAEIRKPTIWERIKDVFNF